ncbi:MAG: transglycosylase SLT domain-containing protein [Thermodesulfovibrionales bacterium]|nr:transglycosylase SLT domain-containing protein [Thermodesulfovibrionales bacterium]
MKQVKYFFKILISSVIVIFFVISDLYPSDDKKLSHSFSEATNFLHMGKRSLENRDFDKAIYFLTLSTQKLPLLADYALFWRAEAYEKRGDLQLAIQDLRRLKEDFKDLAYIKNVRKREVQLSLALEEPISLILTKKYINDYPDDMEIRFLYANRLKERGEIKEAKRIFKEIFLSNSIYVNSARQELSMEDLTLRDLLKKGENLNRAFLFKEAEKYFREALNSRFSDEIKYDLLKGLAESLFRQKRYTESAELFKKIKDNYWYGRSLLRSGDLKTFESELSSLKKTSDPRIGSVLISYGNRKRRSGDKNTALRIFKEVSVRYPNLKEESLWAIGWTHYLNRDFERAHEYFTLLNDNYSDPKYAYWRSRAFESLVKGEKSKISLKNDTNLRDFYSLLNALKDGVFIRSIEQNLPDFGQSNSTSMQRVQILKEMGFKNEAIQELVFLSKKTNDLNTQLQISLQFKEMGSFKLSINSLAKIPYRSELHELFYPYAYWLEIQDVASRYDLDPYLIMAVIREESRFDEEARSIAGAIGLMQLMPQTALRLKNELKINIDPLNLYDPKLNILLGSFYLKKLLYEFKSIPIAVAAYNAGEHAVREWLKDSNYRSIDEFIEDIPYDETRNYVKRVIVSYAQYHRRNANSETSTFLRNAIFSFGNFLKKESS